MTLQRWLSAAVVLSAVIGAGGATLVSQAPRATAANASASGTAPSFLVATLNIRHGLSHDDAVADVVGLAQEGADILGLQEMGSRERRDAVRARVVDCASCPYDTYMPTGSGPAEIPILYRSSMFTLMDKGVQEVSPRTYVGDQGAGPSWIAPKYLSFVLLRHKLSGQDLYVINNHAVASVQASDGGPNHENPERLKLYRKHMDGLKAMIHAFTSTGAAVLTTGDFNVNYRRDSVVRDELFPYHNFRQVGVFASFKELGMPARGTHVLASGNDTRLIDYVAASTHPALTPMSQEVLLGYNSDHRPLLVRYAVASAPGQPTAVSAEPLERAARVTWTAAPANGREITGYEVRDLQTGRVVLAAGDATSVTVTGLTAGSSYSFEVRATNSVGTGPASGASEPVTPFMVPPATTITSGPRTGTFVTGPSVTFGFASDIAGSTFGCALDGVDRPCPGSSATLTGLAQATHTFTVAARDGDGDTDPTPARRWFTVPLDSSTLGHNQGWTRGTGAGYYAGKYIEASRRGAVLRRDVSSVRGLALVATTGPGRGAVQVFLGQTLLKEVDLEGDVLRKRRVLRITRFDTPQTGRVRVVVTSSRQPVVVEGLGVASL